MPPNGSLDEVSVKIGGLEASVKNISQQMDAHTQLHAENHQKLTEKLDNLSTSVTQLVEKVAATDKDVTEMKPAVVKLNAARNRMLGVIGLGTVIVSALFNVGINFIKGS